jgi:hypothetical protein
MPVVDFGIKLGDTLEGLTMYAEKAPGVPITEDLAGATAKFSLRTWGSTEIADQVDAVIVDAGTKLLGFDFNTIAAQLVPSPKFYPHLGWFTIHIATPGAELLSVPNYRYLYIAVFPA